MDKEIRELVIDLLEDIMGSHCDHDSHSYNECDIEGEECQWCDDANRVINHLSPD